jgi:hypothetical protein
MSEVDIRAVGELAEKLAKSHLIASGWKLARYGKEMRRKPDKSLPVVHDNCLNIPFGPASETRDGNVEVDIINKFISDQSSVIEDFIKANVVVNKYIWNFFVKWREENPEPFPMSLDKKKLTEKEKDANRKAMKRFPGNGEHPGRYDFIGFKDGAYAAIEVKANSSRLSYWQEIRLRLLDLLGVKTILLKVTFDDSNFESHSISLLTIQKTDIELPSITEMVSVLGHKPLNERLQEVKKNKKLSSIELLELLQSGLSAKEIVEKYE